MHVTLIHNPTAGDAQFGRDDLVHVIRCAGHEVTYRSSKVAGWRAVLERATDLVVAAGGDGTVDKVGVAMAGKGVPIAILPLGTANNLAKALHLELDVERLIAGWAEAKRRKLDVGIVRGIPRRRGFLEAIGVGVFPGLISDRQDGCVRGDSASARLERDLEAMFDRLAVERARHWSVHLDGHDLSGEHLLVEAMNIGTLGPGLCLAPGSDPGDGMLDVIVVPADERDRLAEHLARHLRGERVSPPFPTTRGRQLVLSGSSADLHVDGKLVRAGDFRKDTLTLHVSLRPHALDILV